MTMKMTMNPIVRAALLLATCALLAATLLAGTHALTAERIAEQNRRAQAAALAIVLPPARHDNDPLSDAIAVHAPSWLGSEIPLRAWRARRGGVPAALVLEAVAPDGYAGPIRLLVGIDARGRVLGVRITEHRETPGLGDAIDAGKSDWVEHFNGRSLHDPDRERWRVRRDGGDFDQFAGATITPRAVLKALRRLQDYVVRHGAELYDAPPGAALEHLDAPED
jgi:electron transport complex protein RnfG